MFVSDEISVHLSAFMQNAEIGMYQNLHINLKNTTFTVKPCWEHLCVQMFFCSWMRKLLTDHREGDREHSKSKEGCKKNFR